jgi:hypothetical protein
MTAGEYDHGTVGLVFPKMCKSEAEARLSRQGSTPRPMDASSVSILIGLQYGVPLRAFDSEITNTRLDPAGESAENVRAEDGLVQPRPD